jgi:hypothetical protein
VLQTIIEAHKNYIDYIGWYCGDHDFWVGGDGGQGEGEEERGIESIIICRGVVKKKRIKGRKVKIENNQCYCYILIFFIDIDNGNFS